MSRLPKTRLSSGMRRCNASLVTGWKWHLVAGLATLSVVLFTESPLFAQVTPEQKLTEAYSLERHGKAASAITQLRSLLDSKSLDPAGIGKAWDVLGLAFEDQGDFSASRHAFEQSIQAYEAIPDSTTDLARAQDDFGELLVTTGQLDLAVRVMERALHLYQATQDHAGVARTSGDLAGALFSQKKIREGRKDLDRAQKESRLTNELDGDDRATIASLRGWLAQCDGDLPTSVSKYQQALDLLRKDHGEEYASTGWAYVLLGQAHAETGDLSRSITEMVEGVAILGRTLRSQDPRLLSAQIAYSRVLDKAGKRTEAQWIRTNAQAQLSAFRRSHCVDCTVSARAFH
jgi:tetratricopeptide (TPR) repeat protein